MSLMGLFKETDERCEICGTDVRDSSIESHGKSFCSTDCMQEYLIRKKETEYNRKSKR